MDFTSNLWCSCYVEKPPSSPATTQMARTLRKNKLQLRWAAKQQSRYAPGIDTLPTSCRQMPFGAAAPFSPRSGGDYGVISRVAARLHGCRKLEQRRTQLPRGGWWLFSFQRKSGSCIKGFICKVIKPSKSWMIWLSAQGCVYSVFDYLADKALLYNPRCRPSANPSSHDSDEPHINL
jgi:hypothetical protein